ncbi:hypothetical protein PFICI_11531 [Pestalotiopsis fici W106-1]|uniref:Uncharacterized protein n=1 Tax=Pestalotiopsis fici (strain W106-1 / CGMCC3.15140) TaxID=1229662 RepID=W3WQQ6_PESFW|nr:uncharacterized protein PFICI_11531 [Pestalotiopsis fici W106-1]ETS76144.1 hypothetical protein PFICI_11531 [Pestalotiopsis fici W106-1]
MVVESFELRAQNLSQQVQALVAEEIFGSVQASQLSPYFHYYSRQCRQISTMSMHHGQHLPVSNHVKLLDLIKKIRLRTSHADITQGLMADHPTCVENVIHNSIDLAVRLLLMIDVGMFEYAYTGRDTITWKAGTIDDFLGTLDLFTGQPELPCEGLKLEASFNVVDLERFAGFDVQLTTNLADHLLVREDVQRVTIFHHATFLQHQREISTIFPPGFVEETLQTIALLFPRGDKRVERWYRRKGNRDELDMSALRCGHAIRHVEKYRFWRDRLVQLKESFDDTKLRTVTQWWHDRRDGVQWWTFWIAIFFTVFFGLVQSIEGALQVYKAYHPT